MAQRVSVRGVVPVVLFACLALGPMAPPAGAVGVVNQTTYVAGAGGVDAAQASDSNDCAAASDPCATLAGALARTASGGTVYLSGTLSEVGATHVNQDVTISAAPDATGATLDGASADANGLLIIGDQTPSATVSISGLTFSNGRSVDGGAIDNVANLAVTGCTFTDDTAIGDNGSGDGGAIDNADNGTTATLSVSDSAFTGDTATSANGSGHGGAIDNGDGNVSNGPYGSGTVTVKDSTFTGDQAATSSGSSEYGNGGAIDSGDSSNGGKNVVTVSGSTFTDDSASIGYNGDGGAIDNGDAANGSTDSVSVTDSTFTGNEAGGSGGAIGNGIFGSTAQVSMLSISGSTFDGNRADGGLSDGGAIDNGDAGAGNMTVTDSTFSNNFATTDGGAIDNGDGGDATATIVRSTLTGNSVSASGDGATIDNSDFGGPGTMYLAAAEIDGTCNQASGGTWNDAGYNAATDASCLAAPAPQTDSLSAAAGHLASLADNGGPTQTIALDPDNPALGLIPDGTSFTVPDPVTGATVSVACPVAADQRGPGFGSVAGDACDAGAVQLESQAISFNSTAPTGAVVAGPSYAPAASSSAGQPVSFSIDAATTSSACALSDGTVTFGHAGSCVLDARAGSANFAPAQAQQTIAVAAATTSTQLTVATGTLTAAVTAVAPGGGTPAGTVAFSVGAQTIGTASLVNGTATLSYGAPANTHQTITAAYQGDDDYAPSTAAALVSGPAVAVALPVGPTITAQLTSSRYRNASGWWRTPVTVAFTCTAGSSTIDGGCPGSVTLSTSSRGTTVARSITTASGATASLTLMGIRIDLTRPAVRIVGVRKHHRYRGAAPAARCAARDRISGIRSCRLRRRVRRTSSGETITYTATATSWAGTTRRARATIHVRP